MNEAKKYMTDGVYHINSFYKYLLNVYSVPRTL